MSSQVSTSGTTRDVPVVPSARTSYRPVTQSGSSYTIKAAPPKRDKK